MLTLHHAPLPLPQVRLYAPYLMAEVTMQGDNMREAMSGGSRGHLGALPAWYLCRQGRRHCCLPPLLLLPVPHTSPDRTTCNQQFQVASGALPASCLGRTKRQAPLAAVQKSA